MEPIERLLACREIEDLATRYAHAFDDQDWDALGKLWTEDASFIAVGVEFSGRQTLMDFLSTCLPVGYGGRHFCARTLVELADDGLSGTGKTDVLWIPENFEITIMARYLDDVVNQDGRWLIKRREEIVVEYKPGPPPMSDTATSISSSSMRL
jgi:uncharacterized protein (TIGR02246 family)